MANNFVTPESTKAFALARVDWNDSVETNLTNFYGPAVPAIANFTFEGSPPAAVPDGTMFRSSITGALYIKDDLRHQSNPIYGGNFTRNGLALVIEENIIGATANITNYERCELFATPNPNARLYMKSVTSGNSFVDIGIPPSDSITTTMLKDASVTDNKLGDNVALKTISQVFEGGTQTFLRNEQFTHNNAAIQLRSETGNVMLGFHANNEVSATSLIHRRGGSGLEVVESDGTTKANLDAGVLMQEGMRLLPIGVTMPYIGLAMPAGWLLLNGNTIGNTASSADHNSTVYQDLYALFWDSMDNVYVGVSTGRGASALADWNANKILTMPDSRGRSVIGTGTGPSLTDREHGNTSGEENHILTIAEMPKHGHPWRTTTTVQGSATAGSTGGFLQDSLHSESTRGPYTGAPTNTAGQQIGGQGDDGAHNIMSPWLALSYIIKY